MTSNPQFEGAVTVPVLWDKASNRIVNNESAEIIRMLNSEFQDFSTNPDGTVKLTQRHGPATQNMAFHGRSVYPAAH
jgi:putative glutathione S-transferase